MNHKRNMLTLILFAVALIPLLLAVVILASPARAATITVTTIDDELNADGDCSLREALLAANTDAAVDACSAGSGADTITVPPGLYQLTVSGAGEDNGASGDLDITGSVTINGGGMGITIVDGLNSDRVFDIHFGAQATLSGLTIQNGAAANGAGINANGDLTLRNSRVTGAIASSVGGAIYAGGPITVTNSRLDGNQANAGGAIFISYLPATVERTEISGNSVAAGGGGIYSSGTLYLSNSTLSGNSAGGDGGGLFVVESPSNFLHNVTISANDAGGDGGGLRALGGVTAANTIIAGNRDLNSSPDQHPDCSGTLQSEGYNLLGNVTGCNISGDNSGNQLGVDPLLGPLQNNGGSTLTHALLGGSTAIDGGNPGGCLDHDGAPLTTDQRGADRPGAGSTRCDIGAYEEGLPPPTPTATATTDPAITPTPTATIDPDVTPTATATPPTDYWQYLPAIHR